MRLKDFVYTAVVGLLACSCAFADDVINVPAGASVSDLDNALQQARDIRAKHGAAQRTPIRIRLAPGDYVLDRTWVIKPEDSGTGEAPLIIESAGPGQASLIGARPLRRKDIVNGVWRYAPDRALNSASERTPGTFFVGANRATLARTPNADDYFFVMRSDSPRHLYAQTQDIRALASMINNDENRAIVHVMQSWTASEHRISSLDRTSGQLELSPASKWPLLNFGRSQRYYVANLPGAFDAPGEWIPQEGMLLYRPQSSERADGGDSATTAYWPKLDTLVSFSGEAKTGRLVQYVQLDNLRFAYTVESPTANGFIDTQAAVKIGATIEADQAEHLTISDCTIEHTGNYGVWLRQGVQHSAVSHNVFSDLGAGGVRIGTTDVSPSDRATSGIEVSRNVITRTGEDYPGAVGIWVGKASNNVLDSNLVSHTSYSGISVGWQWGFASPTAINNVIKNNVLLDIGQGMLSDMAAIYTLGRSPGTKIVGNFIRGVADYPAYGAGGWGIYSDEGSSEIEIRNNVVLETRSGGYHLHFGRDNIVQSNLFALGQLPEISWLNVAKSGSWQLLGNGVVNANRATMDIRGDRSGLQLDNNVFSNGFDNILSVKLGSKPTDVVISGRQVPGLPLWQQTVTQARTLLASLGMADPLQAQPNISSDLLNGRRSVRRSAMSSLSWQFADQPLDSIPSGLRYSSTLPKGLLGVENDAGGRCLRFHQGPNGSLPNYEPHMYVPLDYDDGETNIKFTVKLEPGGGFVYEVRDAALPYHVGATLKLNKDGLMANGVKLSALSVGEWLDIGITIRQLPSKPSTWDLSLSRSGGQPRLWRNLTLKQTEMKGVNWAGFISATPDPGSICVRQLSIANSSPAN